MTCSHSRPATPARPSATSSAGSPLPGSTPAATSPARFCAATAEPRSRPSRQRAGLPADGICDAPTWTALVEAGYRLGDRLLYLRSPMLRGDDVAELQRHLGALGFDAGRVDGIFGPAHRTTRSSEFQRNVGLTTDGVCGPETARRPRPPRRARRGRDQRSPASASARRLRDAAARAARAAASWSARPAGSDALADAIGRAAAATPAPSSPCSTTPTGRSRPRRPTASGPTLYLGLALTDGARQRRLLRDHRLRVAPAAGAWPSSLAERAGADRASTLRAPSAGHAPAGPAGDAHAGGAVRARSADRSSSSTPPSWPRARARPSTPGPPTPVEVDARRAVEARGVRAHSLWPQAVDHVTEASSLDRDRSG